MSYMLWLKVKDGSCTRNRWDGEVCENPIVLI